MRKIGIIFIIIGTILFINLIIQIISGELKDAFPVFIGFIIVVLFSVIGAILFLRGTKARKIAQSKNLPYHEVGWGKIILYFFIGLMLFGVVGSFINRIILQPQKDATIVGQVEKANNLCPIDVIGVGAITSISIEGQQVIYHLQYNDTLINLDLVKQNQEAMKKVFTLSAFMQNAQGPNNGDKLMQRLIREKYGLTIKITSKRNNFSISASPQELSDYVRQVKLNPTEALREVIGLQMQLTQHTLPQVIDSGLVCTDILPEDKNMVYRIKVDESQYSISAFNDNHDLAKKEIYADLSHDPSTESFLVLCKMTKTSIIYRMIGNTSKDSCDIVLDADYISNQTVTPAQLNIL